MYKFSQYTVSELRGRLLLISPWDQGLQMDGSFAEEDGLFAGVDSLVKEDGFLAAAGCLAKEDGFFVAAGCLAKEDSFFTVAGSLAEDGPFGDLDIASVSKT